MAAHRPRRQPGHLVGRHLTGIHLTYARLDRANLTGAYLYRANLTGAELAEAKLADALWPSGAAVPEGWHRNDSGRLRRPKANRVITRCITRS